MILVVDDIVSARDELVRRGVDVSEIWHTEPGQGRVRAWTRSGARTSAARPSRTRTATAGSYRRSPSAYLAGCHR
jgi:hypothetical protein